MKGKITIEEKVGAGFEMESRYGRIQEAPCVSEFLTAPGVSQLSQKIGSLNFSFTGHWWTSLLAQTVKRPPTMRQTRLQSLGWEDLLEKEIATHSSILAWKIPRTEEPDRLQSMGSQRVGQSFHFHFHFPKDWSPQLFAHWAQWSGFTGVEWWF